MLEADDIRELAAALRRSAVLPCRATVEDVQNDRIIMEYFGLTSRVRVGDPVYRLPIHPSWLET